MIIVTWLMATPLGHIVTLVCICSKLTEELHLQWQFYQLFQIGELAIHNTQLLHDHASLRFSTPYGKCIHSNRLTLAVWAISDCDTDKRRQQCVVCPRKRESGEG